MPARHGPGTTSTPGTRSRCSATSSGSRCCSRFRRSSGGTCSSGRSGTRHRISLVRTGFPRCSERRSSAYGGPPFIRGAVRELKDRVPGMMTLISLAIAVAFVFSAAVTLGYPGMPLWEELATLVTIMLLGHWIEMRSISQAAGAQQELAKLLFEAHWGIVVQRAAMALHSRNQGERRGLRAAAFVPRRGQPDLGQERARACDRLHASAVQPQRQAQCGRSSPSRVGERNADL